MKLRMLAVFLCLAALGMWACGDSSTTPSSPSAPPAPPVSQAPAPEPPSSPSGDTGPSAPSLQGVTGRITNATQGGKARAMATNNASVGRHVLLACYSDNDQDIATQELYDWEGLEIQPGESHDFAVDVPDCAWQCDLVVGRGKPKEPPFYTAAELLAFREGGSGDCTPPPPPPPPPGCQLDLRCVEEKGEQSNLRGIIEGVRGLDKHLVCNAPGAWQHDADEAETSETRFWGYWSPVDSPRDANVKFTAAQDPRCMENLSWPIPVDPCVNSELSVRYSFQNRDADVKATVTITAADPLATIDWGDGEQTGPVGPGEYMHVYPKTEQEQSFEITVTTDCDRNSAGFIVPPLPPPCIPPPEQKLCVEDADNLLAGFTNSGCTPIERVLGPPDAECAFFGNYVPGTPGDFFVTKCGQFYEITHDPFQGGQCSNDQDVSHSTACVCGPIIN